MQEYYLNSENIVEPYSSSLNCESFRINDGYRKKKDSKKELKMKSINPYDDFSCESSIECDYIVPSPFENHSLKQFDVPAPEIAVNTSYVYQTKDGKVLVLNHPLPDGFSIEFIFDGGEHSHHRRHRHGFRYNKNLLKDILSYIGVSICPISGLPIYFCNHKKRPCFARRILKFMMASFVILGFILFIAV
ncbi:hypothetical protein TVAG_230680 [Trichomonas vaginalis G3]|uniref:Uncharacterized protein n=1 Tax=Trichomonas vaginalis (strain ATCC PRA-98 / G3) TaxID=412133 RepID=A2EDZ6_TRIV3|nr:hypothetical protein TVAGG3_0890130 [Trichomonas vaginalis G3]EAY09108.1 hypothetical protein TVAG_230680 [Trichomonas vaginalis G3]KAI5502660.1 hypothetical protein TVAGG3_0890130 [Trichomonas vaginalis G3]|eukprot:XP_001321331.1 hypothetical protein [Trichomonas vaginalis G3]